MDSTKKSGTEKAKLLTLWHGLVSVVLGIAGVVNLGLGTLFMLRERADLGAAGLGAGLVLLLAATIDRFETLKGFNVEVKTRELKATLAEAEQVVAKLKPLTQFATKTVMRLLAGAGRLTGPVPAAEAYKLTRESRAVLELVGADDSVREVLEPWARMACLDVTRSIVKPYRKSLQNLLEVRRGSYTGQDAVEAAKVAAATQEVGTYLSSLEVDSMAHWSPDQFAPWLERVVSNAPPFVDAAVLHALKTEVNDWAPELRYLAQNFDFRDSVKWIERIERAQAH